MRAMAVSPLLWAPVAVILVAACGGAGKGVNRRDAAPPSPDAPGREGDAPGGDDGPAPAPVDSSAPQDQDARPFGDGRASDGRTPDGRAPDAAADRAARHDAGDDCPVAPRDGPRDMAPFRDARAGDAMDPAACAPGASCPRGSMCQRGCLGGRIDTCRCSDGRYYCTGCVSVDGGGADARDFPNCSGNVSADGRRCDSPGSICDYPGPDGMKRLCVCGSAGSETVWVCQ